MSHDERQPKTSSKPDKDTRGTLKLKSGTPSRIAAKPTIPTGPPAIVSPPSSHEARRFERDPIDARCFFVNWVLGSSVPRVRYPTAELAARERQRLAKLCGPDKTVVTYRCVAIAGLP
jgi:hypothetical protein